MYRVVIVDDEKIERNGIRFLLRQLGQTFDMKEFANGQAAYEWFQTHGADILLTDVKMPFMDGMELIRRVHERYPEMKIVIFSGFNEFEYAREALRYNVENYILKPVDPQEFEQTIRLVIQELEIRREEKRKQEKDRTFLQEHILYSLVNGVEPSELRIRFDDDELFVSAGRWRRMLLLELDKEFFGRNGEKFEELLEEELSLSYKYLNLNPQQSVLFFEEKMPDWEQIRESVRSCMKKTAPNIRFYLAASEIFDTIDDMGVCFEGMEALMERKFYQQESCLFVPEHEASAFGCSQETEDTLMKQMRQDIRVKDMESLRLHYRRLCEKYLEKPLYSQNYVKFIFANLLKDCYDELPQKTEQDLNYEIEKIYRAGGVLGVMQIAEDALQQLERQFGNGRSTIHPEIETVKQYIYQNYEKELGIELLAEKVYMAPAYLSTLFKKETGQKLSKFIKTVRMERAKELLEGTHRKIVDISTAVGYANVSYFCQSFREYFGVSPQRFRSKGETYEEAVEET